MPSHRSPKPRSGRSLPGRVLPLALVGGGEALDPWCVCVSVALPTLPPCSVFLSQSPPFLLINVPCCLVFFLNHKCGGCHVPIGQSVSGVAGRLCAAITGRMTKGMSERLPHADDPRSQIVSAQTAGLSVAPHPTPTAPPQHQAGCTKQHKTSPPPENLSLPRVCVCLVTHQVLRNIGNALKKLIQGTMRQVA